jgi:hypothetical protein
VGQLLSPNEIPSLALFEDNDGMLVDSELPFENVPYEFVPQMQNFLRATWGEEAPVNSSIQAVQLMEMLDAIYESSHTGREVVL